VNTIEKSPMQCTTYWRCLGLFSSIPYHTIQQHGLQYTTQIVLSIALGIMLPDCHYFLYYGKCALHSTCMVSFSTTCLKKVPPGFSSMA